MGTLLLGTCLALAAPPPTSPEETGLERLRIEVRFYAWDSDAQLDQQKPMIVLVLPGEPGRYRETVCFEGGGRIRIDYLVSWPNGEVVLRPRTYIKPADDFEYLFPRTDFCLLRGKQELTVPNHRVGGFGEFKRVAVAAILHRD